VICVERIAERKHVRFDCIDKRQHVPALRVQPVTRPVAFENGCPQREFKRGNAPPDTRVVHRERPAGFRQIACARDRKKNAEIVPTKQYDFVGDYLTQFAMGSSAGQDSRHCADLDYLAGTLRTNNALKYTRRNYAGFRGSALYAFPRAESK